MAIGRVSIVNKGKNKKYRSKKAQISEHIQYRKKLEKHNVKYASIFLPSIIINICSDDLD